LELLPDDNPRIVAWSPSVRALAYIFVLFLFVTAAVWATTKMLHRSMPTILQSIRREHLSRTMTGE
jgi:hypothetical protein